MIPPIHESESQVAYVERVLRHVGSIATYDALYGLTDTHGRRRSISRLASVIHTLRHQRGWVIAEMAGAGALATYTVVMEPGRGRPLGRVRECPVCHNSHAPGTTCPQTRQDAPGAAEAAGAAR